MRILKTLLLIGVVVFLVYAAWIKIRSLDSGDDAPPLSVSWEGFYHDYNYRDLGLSLNECLGEKIFKEGMVFRSAGWFSGWDCEKIGNPDVIYSLNYSPRKKVQYFCQADASKKIGRYFNPGILLDDLEFEKAWENEQMKQAACRFFVDIFNSVQKDKRILIHCSAGRDRTGTFSALLAGLAAERRNLLDEKMLGVIECDYRKTESLVPEKFGRMSRFLTQLKKRGTLADFFKNQCSIPLETSRRVADLLLNNHNR